MMEKKQLSSTSAQKNETRLKPVVTAVERKRTLGEKLKGLILATDGSDITGKIKKDAESTVKNLVFDSFKTVGAGITDAIGTMVFGEDYAAKKKRQQNGFVNYGGYYYPSITTNPWSSPITTTTATGSAQSLTTQVPTNPKWQFDGYALSTSDKDIAKREHLVYDPLGEIARGVPRGLIDAISAKNYALVSDFFDLVNRSWDYTAQSWGWTELTPETCFVSREHGYWILNIPDPVPVRR